MVNYSSFDELEKLTNELCGNPMVNELESLKNELRKLKTKKTILIADDNRLNQTVLKLILEKEGYNILVCYNGQEALDVYKNNIIDTIYMDVNMVPNGLWATKQIRIYEKKNNLNSCQIIGYTGADDKKDECLEAGMNDVIIKGSTSRNDILEKIL